MGLKQRQLKFKRLIFGYSFLCVYAEWMFLFWGIAPFSWPFLCAWKESESEAVEWASQIGGERLRWMDDLIGCRDWSGCTGIGSLWAQVFWNTTLKEILAAVIFGQRNLECEKCLASLAFSLRYVVFWLKVSLHELMWKRKCGRQVTTDQKPWAQTV